MFLHSGASLHGHEFHHNPQRKKPFLRSALPAPILRSSTTSEAHSPPQRLTPRRRPASEVFVRPLSDLLTDDLLPPPARARARAQTSAPTPPVVRFKDLDVVDEPLASPSMTEDEPSFYDSDASQATASTPRRRGRRSAARSSTAYLVALPAPKLTVKKALLKTIRPRLLLQLQELASGQRPRPTIDVFPASLIAGPLATARYIHRFPRMFGVKGELGPRDLILVKSENYTAEVDDEEEGSQGRRQPVAVLSPGRGQGDAAGEIVLDDGSVWTCSSQKGHYSFVHVDESGASLTARWVRRNPAKRISSAPGSRSVSPAASPTPFPGSSDPPPEADYRYTFSIINPLSRRHPILATLTPQSMVIYHDYTTPSTSSGRYPPTRPVSGAMDSMSSSDPLSPLSMNEPSVERETHPVDEDTRKLIKVTGLWLALQLGPAPSCTEPVDAVPQQDSPAITQSSTLLGSLPRRQTVSTASSTPPPPLQQRCIRRAMSTGAAFIQRRRQKESLETPSGVTVNMGKMSGMDDANKDEAAAVSAVVASAPPPPVPLQKQARRVSWFKRLTH